MSLALLSCGATAARSLRHSASLLSSNTSRKLSNTSGMLRDLAGTSLHDSTPQRKLVADPIHCPVQLNALSKSISPWEELLDSVRDDRVKSASPRPKNEMGDHEKGDPVPVPGTLIPSQLVLTAKQSSLDQMPQAIQFNVKRNMQMSPELRLRWLGDCDCLEFIRKHYDDELARFYSQELIGNLRGDICRAAVLAKEGGFYIDVDVEMKEPLTSLVDNHTTFLAGVAAPHGIMFNAIMAATPGNEIMTGSVEEIRSMYRQHGAGAMITLLGCTALTQALAKIRHRDCAENYAPSHAFAKWTCGKEVVRLFDERKYNCDPYEADRREEDCPPSRTAAMWSFEGAQWGIFSSWPEDKLVAWSRMHECTSYGCGAGGYEQSDHLYSQNA